MGKFVKTFGEMTKADFQAAGGKAANLGELTQNGFNVPPGFCVTSEGLTYHLTENNLHHKIEALAAELNYEDFGDLDEKTAQIRDLIAEAEIPQDLASDIIHALADLNGPEECFVAIRSSVAVKNSDVTSFPGMMDTYHYIKGEKEIIENIKKCWGSLWTTRATVSRHHKKIDHKLGLIAPVVQKMVHSEIAGVLFTANPINSLREEMVIEANWGLGESVVSGKSMNDFFLLKKNPITVKDKRISKKTLVIGFDEKKGYGRKEITVEPEMMDTPTLTDARVLEVGGVGLKIEEVFGFPQDIEWAYANGELFILQSRNIRTLKG